MAKMISPHVETTVIDHCTDGETSLCSHGLIGRAIDYKDAAMDRTVVACTFQGRVFVTEERADYDEYDALSGLYARLQRALFVDDGETLNQDLQDALTAAAMPCGWASPRLHIHLDTLTPARGRKAAGYEVLIAASLLRLHAGSRVLITASDCPDLSPAGFIPFGDGLQVAYASDI